jgi:hypothetical protein
MCISAMVAVGGMDELMARAAACSELRLGELLALASYLVLSSVLSSRQQESHVNLTVFAC